MQGWGWGSTAPGSRLLPGTAQYSAPEVLAEAVRASGAGAVTVALRREATLEVGGGNGPHGYAHHGDRKDGETGAPRPGD